MTLLKLYTEDQFEYLKDGYFEDNTPLRTTVLPNIEVDTNEATCTVFLYKLDEEKFRAKEVSVSLFDEITATVLDGIAYIKDESFSDIGLFRYVTDDGSVQNYSDVFCVVESYVPTELKVMKGGMLKIYNADYFEYSRDGYFDNKTELIDLGRISSVYFDSELIISSITAGLYKVNEEDLREETISERKVKSISMVSSGSTVYYKSIAYSKSGVFRYRITVTPTVGSDEEFFSELFCTQLFDYGTGIGAMIIEDTFIIA